MKEDNMIGPPDNPKKARSKREEMARDAVRTLLHEFYIEMATTKMSKETFEGYLDRFIKAATPANEETK
jgi:hypothetical protein